MTPLWRRCAVVAGGLLLGTSGVGCAETPGTRPLPSATALTYTAPTDWTPLPPPTRRTPELHFVSAYRAPEGSRPEAELGLHTLWTPPNLPYPETPDLMEEFSNALRDPKSDLRWLDRHYATVAGYPAMVCVSRTTYGSAYRWIVFSRQKIFVLVLRVQGADSTATHQLTTQVLESVQVK